MKNMVSKINKLFKLSGILFSLDKMPSSPFTYFSLADGVYDVESLFSGVSLITFGLLVLFWVPVFSNSCFQVGAIRLEIYALLIIALCSCISLICSTSLLVTILSLEVLSFCSYVLVVSKITLRGAFGGWLYSICGGIMTLFALLGSAILVLYSNSSAYPSIGHTITTFHTAALSTDRYSVYIAVLLLFVIFLFKLGAAPYHKWLPEVYAGAPLGIVALFATVVKFSVFVAFIRFILFFTTSVFFVLSQPILLTCGCLSLIVGSIGGLGQGQIKRLLAYSSIAHVGFILIGLAYIWLHGFLAVASYIIIYVFSSLGIFSVLTLAVRDRFFGGPLVYITDLAVLRRHFFLLPVCFVSLVFSMLGLPPFSGFFIKYGILSIAVEADCLWLVGLLILSSSISAFYYLRMIHLTVFGDERTTVPSYYVNYRICPRLFRMIVEVLKDIVRPSTPETFGRLFIVSIVGLLFAVFCYFFIPTASDAAFIYVMISCLLLSYLPGLIFFFHLSKQVRFFTDYRHIYLTHKGAMSVLANLQQLTIVLFVTAAGICFYLCAILGS